MKLSILGWRIAILLALAPLGLACAHKAGQFVWVDEYDAPPPSPPGAGYRISAGDVLNVRVWDQESMSSRVRVRQDGMISLPFVNDVAAEGEEPQELALRLQAKLTEFMVNPVVTVAVDEQAPFEVSVLGEVARPGVYRFAENANLLKVLATAGGLTPLARRDRIYVVREVEGAPTPTRIRFKYDALTRIEGKAASFAVRPRDAVVVD
jgi:polysaccharide biosynthesis/export protein